jgi:hypothetical protein
MQLMTEVQQHLTHLAELARAEAEAISCKSDNTWLAIDREIEHAVGEKERSLGALKQHQNEHGC